MEYTNVDIKRQLNSMVFLNVLSYSVLSGCGNSRVLSTDDYADLDDLLEDIPQEQRPYNVFINESLFKKGLPQYELNLDDPYDFASFKWVKNKQKREISIDVMAASIIACCNLIERILTFDLCLENPEVLVYILHKTANRQAKFIKKHLKVGNIYYNGESEADGDDGEIHVQITSKNPERHTQFAVMHAFSCLAQLNSYNIHYLNYDHTDIEGELDILPGMLSNLMECLKDQSTKDLALIGLHLADMYVIGASSKEMLGKALKPLTKEVGQRISQAGLLKRSRKEGAEDIIEEPASPLTFFNSLNLLSQAAFIFSSKSSFEAGHKLYELISPLWVKEGRIFKLKDSNKQTYKTKVTAAILSALFSYSRIVHEQDKQAELQKQLLEFADTALFKSGVFNGQYHPILQNNKIELQAAVHSEKPWAPVFNKAFEYKISKKKFYCEADMFRADDIMPGCAMLLTSINS